MTYKHKITGTQAKLAEDGKYYIHNCSIGIPKQFIEDSKVWFKQDGFEILSLKSRNNDFIYYKEGYTFPECFQTLVKARDVFNIHSIKRISDGAIFSVNDKIYFRGLFGNNSEHKYDTIKGFDFKQDGTLGVLYHNGIVGLDKIEKYKESILITKDGVELFGGDKCYIVSKDYLTIQYSEVDNKNIMYLPHFNSYFAKKENAEKYVTDNEKRYSLNDIRKVLNNELSVKHYTIFDPNAILEQLQNEI